MTDSPPAFRQLPRASHLMASDSDLTGFEPWPVSLRRSDTEAARFLEQSEVITRSAPNFPIRKRIYCKSVWKRTGTEHMDIASSSAAVEKCLQTIQVFVLLITRKCDQNVQHPPLVDVGNMEFNATSTLTQLTLQHPCCRCLHCNIHTDKLNTATSTRPLFTIQHPC